MPCHTYDYFAFVYMLYVCLFLLNIPYELVLTGMHTDNYHTERVLVGTGPIPGFHTRYFLWVGGNTGTHKRV